MCSGAGGVAQVGGGGVSAAVSIDLSVELHLGLNKVLMPFE